MIVWCFVSFLFVILVFFYQIKKANKSIRRACLVVCNAEAKLRKIYRYLISIIIYEINIIIDFHHSNFDIHHYLLHLRIDVYLDYIYHELEKLLDDYAKVVEKQWRFRRRIDFFLKWSFRYSNIMLRIAERVIFSTVVKNRILNIMQLELKLFLAQECYFLENVIEFTVEDVRSKLMSKAVYLAKRDAVRSIKNVEAESKRKIDKRAVWAIGAAIQRIVPEMTTDMTLSSIRLPNNDTKGKLIGREGRNIRSLEKSTGCDLIVDDIPETISISSFDPIRREVARQTIMRLLSDGRIHPARVEELAGRIREEIDVHLAELGEDVCNELGFFDIHPKLYKLLGRLNYRTSYGQNILIHSREVSTIAGYMAVELGLNPKPSRRAGLFHDIGKAIDKETHGTHVEIGMELLRRFGETADIVHAVGCHHGDYEPKNIEAMVIIAADSLSASRPGVRREMLATYVKRLEDLEKIANSYTGVQSSFAVQAGREVRVIVDADRITDTKAMWMSKDIAKRIEYELQYPGYIKVIVIRETRAIEYAQ